MKVYGSWQGPTKWSVTVMLSDWMLRFDKWLRRHPRARKAVGLLLLPVLFGLALFVLGVEGILQALRLVLRVVLFPVWPRIQRQMEAARERGRWPLQPRPPRLPRILLIGPVLLNVVGSADTEARKHGFSVGLLLLVWFVPYLWRAMFIRGRGLKVRTWWRIRKLRTSAWHGYRSS